MAGNSIIISVCLLFIGSVIYFLEAGFSVSFLLSLQRQMSVYWRAEKQSCVFERVKKFVVCNDFLMKQHHQTSAHTVVQMSRGYTRLTLHTLKCSLTPRLSIKSGTGTINTQTMLPSEIERVNVLTAAACSVMHLISQVTVMFSSSIRML